MKKILAMITAFVCVFVFSACGGSGSEEASGGGESNIYAGGDGWILDKDGVLTISGEAAMKPYSAGDPSPWFPHRFQVERVVVNEGVTVISSWAFKELENVTEIQLPDSLQYIKDGAFMYCSSLETLTIPAGVTGFTGDKIFQGCDNLTLCCAAGSPAADYAEQHGIAVELYK